MHRETTTVLDNKEISATPPETPAMAESITPVPEKGKTEKPFVSKGARLHKWGTYLGVDWIFNAAVGVGFAYWGKFSASGKKCWSGPISKGFDTVLKPFVQNPSYRAQSVEYGNIFMSIIAGGMFTIPPLLVLENKQIKRCITEAIDKQVYSEEELKDPKFQASYEAIENAPKKDFTCGLTSRFAALSPLLAMVLVPVTRKASDKAWFNHVAKGSENLARGLGFSPESFSRLSAPEAAKRWDFIHRSVAMDFGLGVPYAVLHAFFYNKFADAKKKGEECIPLPALPSVPLEGDEEMLCTPSSKKIAKHMRKDHVHQPLAHGPKSFAEFAQKPVDTEVQLGL